MYCEPENGIRTTKEPTLFKHGRKQTRWVKPCPKKNRKEITNHIVQIERILEYQIKITKKHPFFLTKKHVKKILMKFNHKKNKIISATIAKIYGVTEYI